MGTVGETEILKDAVTTTKIKDANVTTAKIADAAVTNAKLNIQLTDIDGEDKYRIKDRDGKIVFLVDSKGNIKFTGNMSKTITSADY